MIEWTNILSVVIPILSAIFAMAFYIISSNSKNVENIRSLDDRITACEDMDKRILDKVINVGNDVSRIIGHLDL